MDGDTLQFGMERLGVAEGTEVVLWFTNAGTGFLHNWGLVKSGSNDDVAQRGNGAGPDTDYVQPEDPDVIAHTRLLDPGVRSEARFTSPSAGTYQLVCTFPGHNLTMFGDFVVTP